MITGIVAVDNNWGIGNNNQLLFHIKEDMQWFKNNTKYGIVCMGKNTLLSLTGYKPLPDRLNVVLSSNTTFENCINVHSLEELLDFCKDKDVFIIGGAQLYKEMLPYYDNVLVTKVNAEKPADTFFPNLDNDPRYKAYAISDIIKSKDYDIQFYNYVKLKEDVACSLLKLEKLKTLKEM